MKKTRIIQGQIPTIAESDKPTFKFGIEQVNKIQKGGLLFNEPALMVTIDGPKHDVKSGIIKGMIANEKFAQYILDAAEIFKTL